MKKTIIMYDLKLFIKRNLKMILGITLVIFLLFLSVVLFSTIKSPEEESEEVNVVEESLVIDDILPSVQDERDVGNLAPEQQELLLSYLEEDSYIFKFAIENPDYTAFTENQLLKELLINEFNFYSLQSSTNEKFLNIPSLILNVSPIENSSILTLRIGTGNRELNTQLANYYYNLLNDEKLSIQENRTTYMLDQQPILVNSESINDENSSEEESQTSDGLRSRLINNIEAIAIVSLIGVLSGLFSGLFICLLKEKVSNVIPSIYTYDLADNQELIKLDAVMANNMRDYGYLINPLINKINTVTVIVSEDDLESFDVNNHKKVTDLENSELLEIEEVLILIKTYKTSKKWLVKQLEISRIMDIPVKIVRLPFD